MRKALIVGFDPWKQLARVASDFFDVESFTDPHEAIGFLRAHSLDHFSLLLVMADLQDRDVDGVTWCTVVRASDDPHSTAKAIVVGGKPPPAYATTVDGHLRNATPDIETFAHTLRAIEL